MKLSAAKIIMLLWAQVILLLGLDHETVWHFEGNESVDKFHVLCLVHLSHHYNVIYVISKNLSHSEVFVLQ